MTVVARRTALGMMALGFVAVMAAPATAQVFVERAPPAEIIEVVPPPPHVGWHWIPGHNAWRFHRWVWIHGRYVAFEVPPKPALIVETPPPSPGAHYFWVRGHHVFEGRGWAWHPGHWERG